MSAVGASFSERLLDWHAAHGRHDLPWQSDLHPYRVWVSEIMLQQTQVSAVIGYYQRWMARFPDLDTLAAASEDEVLRHWAGLGYYARARNLHAAARQLVAGGGDLPTSQKQWQGLPGIGQSTAGAICAIALGQATAILDGNVKRVLARHAGVQGWPGSGAVAKQLWQIAEQRTPSNNAGHYAQAIMDLGAGCCTRSAPNCSSCPVSSDCHAKQHGLQGELPTPRPRPAKRERHTRLLHATNDAGEILLVRRPGTGLWGGLWSLPEMADDESIDDALRRFGLAATTAGQPQATISHALSHFIWQLRPIQISVAQCALRDDSLRWLPAGARTPGLPAPIARYLSHHFSAETNP